MSDGGKGSKPRPIEIFFKIKLDYDEDDLLYIIYFETEGDKTMFLIQYSELLNGVQS